MILVNKNILISIIFGVIGIGAGFFAGMKYQESKLPNFTRQLGNNQGPRVTGNNTTRAGFRPFSGEIISGDEKSITLKLPDGSSKIVFFTENTKINKAEEKAKEDLKTGEEVMVFGQENSDGSVTAQNIQLNQALR